MVLSQHSEHGTRDAGEGVKVDVPVVLRENFDRLRVLSIRTEVSVDDYDDDDDGDREGVSDDDNNLPNENHLAQKRDATPQSNTPESPHQPHTLRRTTLTLHPKSKPNPPKPAYTEAVGEARLAWRWAEGWRARLRQGGDVVEKARWEWLSDRPERVGVVARNGSGRRADRSGSSTGDVGNRGSDRGGNGNGDQSVDSGGTRVEGRDY